MIFTSKERFPKQPRRPPTTHFECFLFCVKNKCQPTKTIISTWLFWDCYLPVSGLCRWKSWRRHKLCLGTNSRLIHYMLAWEISANPTICQWLVWGLFQFKRLMEEIQQISWDIQNRTWKCDINCCRISSINGRTETTFKKRVTTYDNTINPRPKPPRRSKPWDVNVVFQGSKPSISSEPRKKNLLLSIEIWLVNKDPCNGLL